MKNQKFVRPTVLTIFSMILGLTFPISMGQGQGGGKLNIISADADLARISHKRL